MGLAVTLRAAEMDLDRRPGELGQALAATAAGRARPLAFGQHQGLDDLALAGGDHGGDGAGLSAVALGIAGVLDIGASKDAPGGGAHRRPHPEPGVGRMGMGERRAGGFEQIVHGRTSSSPSLAISGGQDHHAGRPGHGGRAIALAVARSPSSRRPPNRPQTPLRRHDLADPGPPTRHDQPGTINQARSTSGSARRPPVQITRRRHWSQPDPLRFFFILRQPLTTSLHSLIHAILGIRAADFWRADGVPGSHGPLMDEDGGQ